MATGRTTAERSNALPVCRKKSGLRLQPSGPGVAQVSTKTATVSFGNIKLELDAETIQVLLCLLNGYMSQMLNGDLTALSFYAAKDYADKMGVDEGKFAEVANAIFNENDKRRKKHPWVSSGFIG
jgi:hypothetical protein